MTVIGLLLLLAACGKSAQFPLQTWLLDAMEGPTPVSALIHAATMVTAGVYLIVRSQFIFEHTADARLAVAVVGTITLLMGAWIGCAKDDIKKVLAGSTMSQIGYMILAAGLGVAGYAFAIFHLLTHGFFKANMFLGAGSVMHGTNDDVNMRHYGALRKLMPVTFLTFAMGYLAIIGFPGFAGFWSKDKIIETALSQNTCARDLRRDRCRRHRLLHDPADAADLLHQGALGARRTPPRVAEGDDRSADRARGALGARRPPPAQRLDRHVPGAGRRRGPARGAADPGARGHRPRGGWWSRSALPWPGSCSAGVTFHGRRPPQVSVFTMAGRNELYGDAFNDAIIVGPGKSFTSGLATFDRSAVDGGFVGTASAFSGLSGHLRLAQNGYVRSYALSLLVGAVIVLLALVVVNLA